MSIRNPVEWGYEQVRSAAAAVGSASHDIRQTELEAHLKLPPVARIGLPDLRDALAEGYADFAANRTDVMLLCLLYPAIGLVFGRLASGMETLPLLFPLASGFALVGPLAAVGLYEMSQQRERGASTGWADAFRVLRSHSFGAILLLGLILTAIFVLWLIAAQVIYDHTLGPARPASVGAFLRDLFGTHQGAMMIVAGVGIGFLFAVLVLAISVVSFPMLIDRDVGLEMAVQTSLRAVAANPVTMAAWGLIVAAGLVIGSIPFFLGLVVVLPILGHATWHLYRRVVPT